MKKFKKFGPFAYLAKLRNGLFRSMGACLAPQNAFLNNLGLETLGLRMQRHCSNAMELAEFLNGLGHGITVSYPGLKEHPYHEIAAKQFHGGFGAIITLRTESKERAFFRNNYKHQSAIYHSYSRRPETLRYEPYKS